MTSQRTSARKVWLILFLSLLLFSLVAGSTAQSAQKQFEGQIKSIQAKLEEAQKALDDERYEGALTAATDAMRSAEQLPETVGKALYGRAVAQTLMGMAYAGAGDHAQAVEVWRKANEIYDKLTQTEENHATTLEHMAASLEILGQQQQAIDAYWAAANLAGQIGKYEDAVRPELSVLAILGQQPKTAASIAKMASGNYNAGLWQQQLGKCTEAAASFQTSLTYLSKLTGSPDIARVGGLALEGLSTCLAQLGRANEWVKAGDTLQDLQMYLQSAEYFEKGLALYEAEQPDGPKCAEFHQKIAFEFSEAEEWRKAHKHLQAKLEILKRSANTEREQAETLRDDGLALENDFQYDQAYDAYRSAVKLYVPLLDSQVQIAELLSRAGGMLLALKKQPEALQVYKTTLPLYDQVKNDPRYDAYNHAVTLSQIGTLLVEDNQGSDAIPYYRQALAVSEKSHQDATGMRAKIRWSLGVQLASLGQTDEAVPYLSESYFAYNRTQLQNLPNMDEKERDDFLYWVHSKARYLYRLAIQHPAPWLPLGVQAVVSAKSLTDEISQTEARVWLETFQKSNPEELARVNELRSAVARLVLLGVSEYVKQVDPNREQLTLRTQELKALEASLRKQAKEAWPPRALTIPRVVDVVASLRDGDAILEYVTYSPDGTVNSETKGDERYGAFVLTAQEGRTFGIDLGPASDIDSAILQYRQLYEAQIDPRKFRLNEDELAAQTQKIRQLILDPVLYALAKSEPAGSRERRFYVVPAGTISFVPFEALPLAHQGSAWRYMLEEYEFVYLQSARDLVTSRQDPLSRSNEVWLIGNPDFNAAPGATPGSASADKRYDDSIPNTWSDLGGTGELLKRIEQRARRVNLTPKVLSGPSATETAFNALHSPKFLVVATHGHFMSDLAPVSAITLVSEGMKSDFGADFTAGMDPRMRSMLVLAGANRRYRPLETAASEADSNASPAGINANRGRVHYDTDDGLLTAFEARDIDLRDTDVVMLVGCESGLGIVPRREYRGGNLSMATGMGMQLQGSNLGSMVWTLPQIGDQAVAGLPLSFLVAGARSVISSTSTIPVGENAQLIDDFLEEWLTRNHGSNRYSAFHAAQLNALARARQKGSTHPFQWAGMVYIGPPDDARNIP